MNEATQIDMFARVEAPAAAPAPKLTRQDKARRAYAATSEAWKAAVYKFAVETFLPEHSEFLFEELTIAYRRASVSGKLPETVEPRGFAGLQARLVKEGLIEKTDQFRYRSNSSPSRVYRRIK